MRVGRVHGGQRAFMANSMLGKAYLMGVAMDAEKLKHVVVGGVQQF